MNQEYYQRAHPPFKKGDRLPTLAEYALDTQRWAQMWVLQRDLRSLVVVKP